MLYRWEGLLQLCVGTHNLQVLPHNLQVLTP